MKWFLLFSLLLLTTGFQKEKQRPISSPKKSTPTTMKIKGSGLNNATPGATWQSLMQAIKDKDEKRILALMTPDGLKSFKDIKERAGDDSTLPKFLQRGGLELVKLRWHKQTKDRAEARVGPIQAECFIHFKKTLQGWKLDGYIPGD